jgi:hypothetical protein
MSASRGLSQIYGKLRKHLKRCGLLDKFLAGELSPEQLEHFGANRFKKFLATSSIGVHQLWIDSDLGYDSATPEERSRVYAMHIHIERIDSLFVAYFPPIPEGEDLSLPNNGAHPFWDHFSRWDELFESPSFNYIEEDDRPAIFARSPLGLFL